MVVRSGEEGTKRMSSSTREVLVKAGQGRAVHQTSNAL